MQPDGDAVVDLRIEPGQPVDPVSQDEERHAPMRDGLFVQMFESARLRDGPAHLNLREIIRDKRELERRKIGQNSQNRNHQQGRTVGQNEYSPTAIIHICDWKFAICILYAFLQF